jgi:hypothetical protein
MMLVTMWMAILRAAKARLRYTSGRSVEEVLDDEITGKLREEQD